MLHISIKLSIVKNLKLNLLTNLKLLFSPNLSLGTHFLSDMKISDDIQDISCPEGGNGGGANE